MGVYVLQAYKKGCCLACLSLEGCTRHLYGGNSQEELKLSLFSAPFSVFHPECPKTSVCHLQSCTSCSAGLWSCAGALTRLYQYGRFASGLSITNGYQRTDQAHVKCSQLDVERGRLTIKGLLITVMGSCEARWTYNRPQP